jgi:hypothetical protein
MGTAMRERPILLSDAEVRAILAGTKTQTRRVVQSPAKGMQREGMEVIQRREPGDKWYGDFVWSMRDRSGVWGDYTDEEFRALCPFGAPGDRLWVRECFAEIDRRHGLGGLAYRATEDAETYPGFWRWTPSVQMPRWASRITLEIGHVRVERLHEIAPEDARAEGVVVPRCSCERCSMTSEICTADCSVYVEGFRDAWVSTHGRGGWLSNPWVWVVDFARASASSLPSWRAAEAGTRRGAHGRIEQAAAKRLGTTWPQVT